MMKRIFFMLLAVAFGAMAHGQDTVVIIRHAEKPAKGDNVTCKGLNRSLGIPKVLDARFSVPHYVYVPEITTGNGTKHSRMFQTVTPYAAEHNLKINTAFEKTDTVKVTKDVIRKLDKHHPGIILMVWEHSNIPPLARCLKVPASKVPKWDDNDYDSIWIITGAGTADATLSVGSEGLNGVSDKCPW